MKKTKILYVITKSNWGGAQRYVFDLATAMQKRGFDVAVALGGPVGIQEREGLLPQKLKAGGVRTMFIKSLFRDLSMVNEIRAFFELMKIFKKEKPDIVHLNSSKAAGLGALAARLTDIKRIVFTAHGWPFKENRPVVIRWMIYIATWCTVFLSHQTIVVSKEDERLGKRIRFVSGKITYIPVALKAENEILERELAEQRLSFGISGNTAYKTPCRLVTIAELTRNKGILPYGIEMIQTLEQNFPGTYSYTVFGEGEDLPELQNQSNGLPIYFENVTDYRNKPSDLSTNASRYLKAFDIFILPSIKEGMPYVLLEAATAGLPIVATEGVESLQATIPNLHIVRPKSRNHLARALAEKVEEVSRTMTKHTHKDYSAFEKMLSATEALYTSG